MEVANFESQQSCKSCIFLPLDAKRQKYSIIAGYNDGSVRKLCSSVGRCVESSPCHNLRAVTCVSSNKDGSVFASSGKDSRVAVWSGGRVVGACLCTDTVNSVHFFGTQQILTASRDKLVSLIDVETQTVTRVAANHREGVLKAVGEAEYSLCATASTDNTARLTDTRSQRPQHILKHDKWVYDVAANFSKNLIVTGSRDASVKVWDVRCPERILCRFDGHTKGVTTCALSETGSLLASGSSDRTVKIWSLRDGILYTFSNHTDGVSSVNFNHPGRDLLVSSSHDGSVRVYDLAHYERIRATSFTSCTEIPADVSEKIVSYLW